MGYITFHPDQKIVHNTVMEIQRTINKDIRKIMISTADEFVSEIRKELFERGDHVVTGNLWKSICRKGSKGGWEQKIISAKYLTYMSKGTAPHPLPSYTIEYFRYAVEEGKYGQRIHAPEHKKPYIIKKIIERRGTKPTHVLDRVWNRRYQIIARVLKRYKSNKGIKPIKKV